jgi:hypothetical protein
VIASERVWRVVTSTWFLGVGLFVITWPVASLVPETGLDFSYVAGLHMAAHEHLHFGTQIVGTYGPLGFLRYPILYYTWTTRLALLYTGAVHLALCLTILWALRRTMPVLLAFLLSWVAVSIIVAEPESALVVVIVWLIEYLRRGSSPRLKRVFPVVAGGVGGLEVLIKINTGITIAILGAIAILIGSRRQWRPLAAFAGSFVVTFLIGWFSSGQGLGNIGAYISTARQLINGWSTAMQYPGPNYQLWAALVAALAVLVVAWQSTRGERLGTRAGMLLIWLLLGFSVFKEGFVGQTAGHEIIFFGTALGAVVALSWRGIQRLSVLWCLTLVIVLSYAITQADPGQLLSPSAHAEVLEGQLDTMLSASKRDKLVAAARVVMNAAYGLDRQTLAELESHSVDVVPSEQGILWANKLKWTPIPVFEFYYALTPALDNLNASVLASSSGPERLLRNVSQPVNQRNNLFDSPAAQRSMLCHYAAISTTALYQVLTRVPNRCGEPRLIETVPAHWEQYVQVPGPQRAGDLVYVSVGGVTPHGLESLRTLFWRSYTRVILKEGATGPVRDYNIVPDTVADGLLMSVPAAADFLGAFALNPVTTQLAFGLSSGSLAPGLTYSFFEEPVTPHPPRWPARASSRGRLSAAWACAGASPRARSQAGDRRRCAAAPTAAARVPGGTRGEAAAAGR